MQYALARSSSPKKKRRAITIAEKSLFFLVVFQRRRQRKRHQIFLLRFAKPIILDVECRQVKKTSKCSVTVYLIKGERVEERKRMKKNFYILIYIVVYN